MATQSYGKKVVFGFAIFILLLLFSGLSSLWNLRDISQSNARVHLSAHPVVREATQVQIQLLKLANLSSLAFSEQDLEKISEYQLEFDASATRFTSLYADLEALFSNDKQGKAKIAEIKDNYAEYLTHTRRMFDAKVAFQQAKQDVSAETDKIIFLVDQIGSSLMDITYYSPRAEHKKDMQLISGHADHADGLMVAVIRTALEIKRTNDPARLESAPDDFSFIIKDSMSWFDRAVELFNKMDSNGLASKTYARVATLEDRLKRNPNLMDHKGEQFRQAGIVRNNLHEANLAVEKCILALDKLLGSAETKFERLQSALAASVEFGYISITITILILILLASFHFNSVRLAIQKKIVDLATINKIGRKLALVQDQSTALETMLKTVCKKNGFDMGAAFVANRSGMLEVNAVHISDRYTSKDNLPYIPESTLVESMDFTRIPLFVPDVSKDEIYKVEKGGCRDALLYIPLFDKEDLFGVLCLSGMPNQTAFDESDFEFFVSIAGVLVTTLKNVSMRETIKRHNRSLEATVKERTAALKQKSDDITGMLSNLHQGLFTIMQGGLIHHEYAPYLEEIFETDDIANRKFSNFLFQNSRLENSIVNQVNNAVVSILGGDGCNFDRLSPSLIGEMLLTFPDDRTKNLVLSWDPILDDRNQVTKLLVTVRDVTEYHKAEEQKEILAAVFKNSSEPVAVFDSALYIQAVNAAFSELMSRDDEYLVGSNLSTVLRNMHDGHFFDDMRAEIIEKGTWDGEIRCESGGTSEKVRWLTISAIGLSKSIKDATFLGSFSDILQRQKIEDELRYLANYDALTKLPNRRLFSERVQHAVAIAKRNNSRVALFFIDLNRFKQINDSYGHSTGDELLVQVTQRLNDFVRDSDTLCRLGGDEFTVLIENPSSKDDIEKFANRLLQQFSCSFLVNEHELRAGASIGISVYPDDASTVESMMVNADVAMYTAKKKGIGYLFFEPRMNETSGKRLVLENDLHRALENNELFLTYQPKIELCTGRMIGAEVLLRWEHPVLGLISPNQFIPLAEETGLIIPIGHWVLETACRNLAQWRAEELLPINLAVNVSAKQFQSVNFTSQVKSVLGSTGLDPRYLELEVTESLLMDTESASIETMASLKEMGVSISIDDFGTGYSSLQYLSKFPIDYLKIDRSFVMGLDTGGKSVAIIRAIIAMAEGLGLEVIAEGVEDDGQARLLRQFGCHIAQGFLYSRPLREPDFVKHLAPPHLTNNNLDFLRR